MSARGVPSAAELLEAVEEMLRNEAIPETTGRVQYNLRVAASALAIVQRELALGEGIDDARAERLDTVGFGDVSALLGAISRGEVDARLPELVALERASSRERLAVENPRWAEPGDA